ncbi:MAG TPA: hypothetical protein PKW53_13930, partial [Syntrophorhabdus sp.]|nr:hypothetical protein [Syntrophorhabdus sp.]
FLFFHRRLSVMCFGIFSNGWRVCEVLNEVKDLGEERAEPRTAYPPVKRPEGTKRPRAQRGTERSRVSFSYPKIILPP